MCIGNTSNGWRHLVKWGLDASGNGWSHLSCIYVYPTPEPGTSPFTVSHKVGKKTLLFINISNDLMKGRPLEMEDKGRQWTFFSGN